VDLWLSDKQEVKEGIEKNMEKMNTEGAKHHSHAFDFYTGPVVDKDSITVNWIEEPNDRRKSRRPANLESSQFHNREKKIHSKKGSRAFGRKSMLGRE